MAEHPTGCQGRLPEMEMQHLSSSPQGLNKLPQSSSLASKLVACFARKVAQRSWCSVDEQVPHDGNGVILLRLGPYLEAAERDHAVHHLGHTEAVPEIMKGVVPVIVMNTQLQREGVKRSDIGSSFFTKT